MLLPLAPPPPGAAVQRHSRRPFSASVHEVSELQELRIPALAPCVPVTVLSMGRTQLDQRCLIMNSRGEGIRGTLASWLTALVGEGPVSLSLATAELHAPTAQRRRCCCTATEALQALERFVAQGRPSFMACALDFAVPAQGGSYVTQAQWIDLGVDELLSDDAQGLKSVKEFLSGHRGIAPQPLLEQLLPALCGDRVLHLVICGPKEDPAIGAARELAALLSRDAWPPRSLEMTALREGFAHEETLAGDVLLGAFQELRGFHSSALPELTSGEVRVEDYGFPGHALPSLQPYMKRFQVTNNDRVKLHLAAEKEIEEFEAKGWVRKAPDRLFVQLADAYDLPPEALTTTNARTFARSQDQHDPLVRTITRLRDDATLAVALLPLCAAHPFNMLRVLRLGGVHSLLALLADASALAPRRGEMQSEALSSSEIAALVLTALCACSAVRCFLVSQCIFELLAVAIRHPSSDRLLQIFCALVVRLLRGGLGAGGPQQAAAAALAPALAEQLLCQLRLADASAQALAAASAALSPCLPLEAFSPVLPALLAKLGANCAEAFKALMASLALSAKKHNELDLNSFVPRLLSLMPLEPPKAVAFHSGAAGVLALCSHTAAITSLCRPWVVSTAMALLRSALRPGGLQRVRAAVPLAAAMAAVGQKPMEPENWEVEENISFQRTFGTFPRAGDTAETSPAEKAAAPALRCQRLQGLAMLGQLEMAESPNAANFQDRPQWRVEILDDHSELFLSLSLLPVSRCFSPAYAVDPGQLGFWICEFPEASDDEKNCHQLDLRPPVHVSATPGCEHLVSVALPRGLYTVVPFSSHVVLDTGAERARQLCRSQRCGCVDANLVQPALWDLGSRFAAISMWAESTDLSICQASPWYQRLRIDWSLLTQSLPIWLRSNSPEPLEVLICVTGEDDQALLGTEPCLDLWPELPHRRVRNERTGALRVHVAKLAAMSSLRVSCVWQEPIDPSRSRRPRPQLLVYSSGPLAAFCEPGIPPQLGFCEPPREVQKYWQASALCSGCWTSGFSSGFGSLRNPQVVLEVLRGPSKGEELQLELYLCVPGKGKAHPKTALTVFVRQEEHRASPGAPERLAEGVLRREIGSGKALGSYVVSSLRLTGAESRQQLYCVLQNDDPQETWPWQLRALARIRAKDDSAGEALGAPIGTPDEPPLRCAVLGGVAEPGRIYTCWPEALALYTLKCGKSLGECEELPPGWQQDHISHAWHISHDWDAETVKVEVTSGAVAQCGKEALPWPAAEPTPLVEAEEPVDVTTTLAPLPRVAVEESVAERAQTLVHQERRRPPVPQPPKRLVVRSREDTPREESRTATPTPGTPVARPDLEPPPTERRARLEALLRRRKHGRERIMPDPDFYREDLPRHQANSVPPPRVRRPEREGPGEEMDPPRSARETRNPSLPPIEKERCCGFAGHPVFCCRAEGSRDGKSRHLVRLERRPGSERLGFGNVAAGPATNPVLVISWIRDGALAEWNEKAPEGLAVPVQSAIVSVNGISGDLQRMREALRAQVVDMEIMAPERWRYTKVTRSA